MRDHAFLPRPADIWTSEWIALPAAPVTAEDVEAWPYSVGILVKWVAFLSSLHRPAAGADLGVGGVSFVKMLILCELWAGERLVLEKAGPRCIGDQGVQFQCRLFLLVQALIFGAPAGTLEHFSGHFLLCLVVLVDSCRALLVPITAGFGILGGRSVAMGSLLGLGRQLRKFSSMSCWFSFDILLGLLLLFWRVLCLFGTVLVGLLGKSLLGACLQAGALLTWLSRGERRLVLFRWSLFILLICLVFMVVVEFTGLVGLVET